MNVFHKTTWDQVKAGDTVLIACVGKVVEVVIESAEVNRQLVIVSYKHANARAYSCIPFNPGDTVYVQSRL